MKQSLSFLSILTLLALFAACEPVALTEPETDGPRTVTIGTSYERTATKAEIGDDLSFSWTPGDEIAVWTGRHFVTSEPYVSDNTFTLHLDGIRSGFGVYPASVADPDNAMVESLKVTLPESYDLSGKSVTYSPMPMIAVNNEGADLDFYHVGGLLRLTLRDVPAETVKIHVDLGHRITGSFAVTNPGHPGERDCVIATDNDATAGKTYVDFTNFTLSGSSTLLNLPVPTGTYTTVHVEAKNAADATLAGFGVSAAIDWDCERAWGKKLSNDNATYSLTLSMENLPYDGRERTLTVNSTKTMGSTTSAAPWKTQIQLDGEWVDLTDENRPAWLPSSFPKEGIGGERSYNVTLPKYLTTHEEQLRTAWADEIAAATRRPNGYYDKARVDLSKWNPVTHSLEARTTANCYIVQGPGDYMFPMVYGNAVDLICYNASDNTGSYDPQISGAGVLNKFRNHLENATEDESGGDPIAPYRIKQPWISADPNFGDNCTEVGILWQQFNNGSTNVITDLSICNEDQSAHKMVCFTVTENISPGNAVIYVKDTRSDMDCIAWSWHIWITDQDMHSVRLKNSSNSAGYPLQPVNLGWIDDSAGQYYAERSDQIRFVIVESPGTYKDLTLEQEAEEVVSTSGWSPYYQWGRKDPLRSDCGVINDELHHIYFSIRNPQSFLGYRVAGTTEEFDWTDNGFRNLWRAENNHYTASNRTATTGKKTVYDPCPRGYIMAPGCTWDGLSGTWESGKGWFFNTGFTTPAQVFFPASGYIRMENTGSTLHPDYTIEFRNQGTNGYYWTDFPSSIGTIRKSFGMKFDSSTITADGSSDSELKRAYAFSVRCVRDDRLTDENH